MLPQVVTRFVVDLNQLFSLVLQLQLTRQGVTVAPGQEPQSIIVPILYDQNTNTTLMTEQRGAGATMTPASMAATKTLKHFAEINQLKQGECSIFPAVRELLTNLAV